MSREKINPRSLPNPGTYPIDRATEELLMLLENGSPLNLNVREKIRRKDEQSGRKDEQKDIAWISDHPPEQFGADLAIACYPLASSLKMSPVEIAQRLAQTSPAENGLIARMEGQGPEGQGLPYLNVFFDQTAFPTAVVDSVFSLGPLYGGQNVGRGRHEIIDLSSPNIAKRMSVGHLRSTVIGEAIARIHEMQGYRVTKDNHIGDWGTGFGKLIAAITNGEREGTNIERMIEESEDPVEILQGLYVAYEGEITKEKGGQKDAPSESEDAARVWFKRLEDGDLEARRIWGKCVDWSMKEFQAVYNILGSSFDVMHGESFYESQLESVIQKLREVGLLQQSEGAWGVDLSPEGKSKEDSNDKDRGSDFVIVQKKDGASNYMTRDLATGMHRVDHMGADMMTYVVGEDQIQYFQQYFEILRRVGYPIADKSKHVYFGMVSLPEGKMSTRKGRVVLLQDVISESLDRAEEILHQQVLGLIEHGREVPPIYQDPEARAILTRQIGVGSLVYNDLKNTPQRGYVYDLERSVAMEGNSAPYIQYAHARAMSVLSNLEGLDLSQTRVTTTSSEERNLVRMIGDFPRAVQMAGDTYNPSVVATHLFGTAQAFSRFWHSSPIATEEDPSTQKSRAAIAQATAQVLKNGLGLLNIEAPDRM